MSTSEILSIEADTKLNNEKRISEKIHQRHDHKRKTAFQSPDTHKLQEVIIDYRTKIYIGLDASADEARTRYLNRLDAKVKIHSI